LKAILELGGTVALTVCVTVGVIVAVAVLVAVPVFVAVPVIVAVPVCVGVEAMVGVEDGGVAVAGALVFVFTSEVVVFIGGFVLVGVIVAARVLLTVGEGVLLLKIPGT